MRVRVRLVSLLREAVGGAREVELELPGGEASLDEVLRALFSRYPRLGELVKQLEERGLNIVYMVDGEAGDGSRRVRDGSTVTILPPASGG